MLVGAPPLIAIIVLVSFFFLIHYMFASLTAHTMAVLPALLAAGVAVPGMPVRVLAMLLVYSIGLMGVVHPLRDRAGPGLLWKRVHSEEGFLDSGIVFGLIYPDNSPGPLASPYLSNGAF